MDLTLLATPAYFATMGIEHVVLKRRAAVAGPGAADYERADTLASLSMGVGSILGLAQHAVLRRVVPGRTRAGTAVVGVAVAAAVATTIADRRIRARAEAQATAPPDRAAVPPTGGVDAAARQVARVGGVTAMAAGALALAAGVQHLTSPRRQWERHGARRDLGSGVAGWAVALVGWDLIYYANHRLMHEVRVMWAVHVVHHSSERYNLSTALRQPVSALGVWVPYGAMARAGVRPQLIEYARAVNLLYQYWIHTESIGGRGPAYSVLNSPSHHRVHHGSNRRYLDRNHGGILIIWDRLFGTFEREDPDDPPVYGLTRNIDTFNPLRIVTHEYADLVRDIAASTTWRDRLSFVFRGPGWAYRRRAAMSKSM